MHRFVVYKRKGKSLKKIINLNQMKWIISKYSGFLREYKLICRQNYVPSYCQFLNERNVTSCKKSKGSCNGDSGGPLVCETKLVGIDSWTIGECGKFLNVYTNVGRYPEWTLRETSINPNECGS